MAKRVVTKTAKGPNGESITLREELAPGEPDPIEKAALEGEELPSPDHERTVTDRLRSILGDDEGGEIIQLYKKMSGQWTRLPDIEETDANPGSIRALHGDGVYKLRVMEYGTETFQKILSIGVTEEKQDPASVIASAMASKSGSPDTALLLALLPSLFSSQQSQVQQAIETMKTDAALRMKELESKAAVEIEKIKADSAKAAIDADREEKKFDRMMQMLLATGKKDDTSGVLQLLAPLSTLMIKGMELSAKVGKQETTVMDLIAQGMPLIGDVLTKAQKVNPPPAMPPSLTTQVMSPTGSGQHNSQPGASPGPVASGGSVPGNGAGPTPETQQQQMNFLNAIKIKIETELLPGIYAKAESARYVGSDADGTMWEPEHLDPSVVANAYTLMIPDMLSRYGINAGTGAPLDDSQIAALIETLFGKTADFMTTYPRTQNSAQWFTEFYSSLIGEDPDQRRQGGPDLMQEVPQ